MKISLSPYFNERPEGIIIDTFVVHTISSNPDCSAEGCINLLLECEVAPHYLISQEGELWQLVPEDKRAWHAGASKMPFDDDNRENVNNFSIGVELVTPADLFVTDSQYAALAELIADVASRHPLKAVVGHDQIAPGRKVDPGPNFEWVRLRDSIVPLKLRFLGFSQ